jgi:hypothetical protein
MQLFKITMPKGNIWPPIEVDEPFKFEKRCKKRLFKDSDCVLVKRWKMDFSFPNQGRYGREDGSQFVTVSKIKLYPNVTFDIFFGDECGIQEI